MSFFSELKRRNVYKVAVAYAVVAWLLIQAASIILPTFEAPAWTMKVLMAALVIGFPLAIVLSWAFEITPEGIKRESEVTPNESITAHTGRKLVGLTIALAVIAAGLMAFQFLRLRAGRPMEGGASYDKLRTGSAPPEGQGLAGAPARNATDSVAGGRPSIPEKSIAVLPFDNLSRDPENAYFADGIQDEILARLSQIADLKVISRTSTQKYKNAPTNLREIAQQLGVAHILEGSVQKVNDQVRVTVQLINAADDAHLWASTYDRKLTDIFTVESEIAKSIADSLQAKLTGREVQALALKPTTNPEAYDAYLRGLAAEGQSLHSVYAFEKAAEFYDQAVRLDPAFALAWSRLSRANAEVYSSPNDPTGTRRDAVKRALDMAQKLQPDSPETLLALAYYQLVALRDNELAKTTFRLVGKMLPGSSEVPYALARIAQRQGHWDEATTSYEQALVLDPRNMELLVEVAFHYAALRKFAVALKMFDRGLDIVPHDPDVMAFKAGIYQGEGNLEEAAKLLREVNAETSSLMVFGAKITQLNLERNLSEAVRLLQARVAQYPFGSELEKGAFTKELAVAQYVAGDSAGARITAEQARKTLEPICKNQLDNDFAAICLSNVYAVLGEKELALKEAKRAIAIQPSAQSAGRGPRFEENLTVIRTIVGENNAAISTLSRLLVIPYDSALYGTPVTPALLRLDPTWDPLRADPAFRKLYEEKRP